LVKVQAALALDASRSDNLLNQLSCLSNRCLKIDYQTLHCNYIASRQRSKQT